MVSDRLPVTVLAPLEAALDYWPPAPPPSPPNLRSQAKKQISLVFCEILRLKNLFMTKNKRGL